MLFSHKREVLGLLTGGVRRREIVIRRCRVFFGGMLTCSVKLAIPSQSGWEFSFLKPFICYAVSISKGGWALLKNHHGNSLMWNKLKGRKTRNKHKSCSEEFPHLTFFWVLDLPWLCHVTAGNKYPGQHMDVFCWQTWEHWKEQVINEMLKVQLEFLSLQTHVCWI